MAPAGGIMCSIVLTAILCDLIDCRFKRASIFSLIGIFFSLFGIMHGCNYVFWNGQEMHAMPWTTDLGEVMLSTYVFPTINAFGFPIPDTPKKSWGYRIDDNDHRAFNEGWRFSIAYAMLF